MRGVTGGLPGSPSPATQRRRRARASASSASNSISVMSRSCAWSGAVGEARPIRAHGGAARGAPPRLIGIVERRSPPPRQRHSARGVDEWPEEAERVIRRREELDDSGTRPRDRRPRQSGTMRSYYNILPPGPRELRVEVQTSKVDDVEPLRTGPLGDAARQPPLVLPHDHSFAGRDRGGFSAASSRAQRRRIITVREPGEALVRVQPARQHGRADERAAARSRTTMHSATEAGGEPCRPGRPP